MNSQNFPPPPNHVKPRLIKIESAALPNSDLRARATVSFEEVVVRGFSVFHAPGKPVKVSPPGFSSRQTGFVPLVTVSMKTWKRVEALILEAAHRQGLLKGGER